MIIGLTGLAGSGKSEVAHALRDLGDFKRTAFAGPLKSMLAAIGFTDAQLYGDEKEALIEDLGVTARHAMQTIGTNWGRKLIHPDIWLKMWARKADQMLSEGLNIVADDVRFPNEVEAIRARGGQVWRITRPGIERMGHESEDQDFDVDEVIHNTAGLYELRVQTGDLLALALAG